MVEVTLNSLDRIVSFANERSTSSFFCYRGQAKDTWSLVPSIFRPLTYQDSALSDTQKEYLAKHERDIYREFDRYSRMLVDTSMDKWERICVAQHHGAPSRLLDWTANIQVAIYLAVAELLNHDAAIWCLDVAHIPFPDGLGRRHWNDVHRLQNIIEYCGSAEPSFLKKSTLHIRGRSNNPESFFVIFKPSVIDERIERQDGLLSLHLSFSDDELVWNYSSYLEQIEKETSTDILTKIIIPAGCKADIRRDLEKNARINHFSLFPGLDGLGKWLTYENEMRITDSTKRT